MRTKLDATKAHYHTALANLNQRRQDYYEQIRVEHANGDSLRVLAASTGLTFQRIYQIVNGK
jgi:hypothetical protein